MLSLSGPNRFMATERPIKRTIEVTLVYGQAQRRVLECTLVLAEGSCVVDALRASTVVAGLEAEEIDLLEVGIWGRPSSSSALLRDRDRIELCRPLLVDPKVARRARFVRQGAKSAGLFAKRRSGAKAGY